MFRRPRFLPSRSVLLAGAVVVLLVGLPIARLCLVSGRFGVVRVVSSSMANALVGPHFAWTCADCGVDFRCDLVQRPKDDRVVCPNCGYDGNTFADATEDPGDRVLIDRFPFLWRNPRRYELVVFRRPPDRSLEVKRVVATPGESLLIRNGDLFIDEAIARKTYDEYRALALLVHDARHQPHLEADLPRRWRAASEASGWTDAYTFRADRASTGGYDWLVYHHWLCMSSSLPRAHESAILDNYGLNQDVSRELNRVTDLSVRVTLQVDGPGRVALWLSNGRETLLAELDFEARTVSLSVNGKQRRRQSVPSLGPRRNNRWELAYVDQRVLLAMDGKELLSLQLEQSSEQAPATSRPVKLGVDGANLRLSELQIWRDIYWLPPNSLSSTWRQGPLAADEFTLLGDNAPLALDSRALGPLHRKSLVGKVFPR